MSFRVGNEYAQFLEQQFAPVFFFYYIMNVPNYNAFLRILANGVPTKPFSMATMPPIKSDPSVVASMIAESAARNGRPRAEVEAEISARYAKKPAPTTTPGAMM